MRDRTLSRRSLLGTLGTLGTLEALVPADATRTDDGPRTPGPLPRHLLLAGGSPASPVRYAVGFTGDAEPTTEDLGLPVERATVDPGDYLTDRGDGGRAATGRLAGGADAYRFDGAIDGFGISLSRDRLGEVSVYLDGVAVDPAELGRSPAAGTPVEFVDCGAAVVSGEFESVLLDVSSIAGDGGLSTDRFERGPVTGRTAVDLSGLVSEPFSLDFVTVVPTATGTSRTVTSNPYAGFWCLEQPGFTHRIVVFGGSPDAPATYELTTGATLRRTTDASGTPAERATIDPDDSLAGNVARGTVAGGADAYVYTGDQVALDLSGDARVFVDGREVDPATLAPPAPTSSVIVVFGGSASDPVTYAFEVTGSATRTTDLGGAPVERATIDPEDTVSGGSVSGVTAGGADAYRFTGRIESFSLVGPGRVFLDGEEVDPATLAG